MRLLTLSQPYRARVWPTRQSEAFARHRFRSTSHFGRTSRAAAWDRRRPGTPLGCGPERADPRADQRDACRDGRRCSGDVGRPGVRISARVDPPGDCAPPVHEVDRRLDALLARQQQQVPPLRGPRSDAERRAPTGRDRCRPDVHLLGL